MGEVDYLTYIKKHIRISQTVGILCVVICSLGLIGWIFNIPFLRSFTGTNVNINPFSAILLSALAIAAILYNVNFENKIIKAYYLLVALLGLLVGVGTGLNYILNLGFNYDTFILSRLINDSGLLETSRIVPSLSFGLIIISVSLLLIYFKQNYRIINLITLLGVVLGWLGILGRFYQVQPSFENNGLFVPLALNTSLAIFFLSLSILIMIPYEGYIKLILNDNIAGATSRLLIPTSFLITATLGFIGLNSVRNGVFPNDLGVLYFVVINSVIFVFLFYYNGLIVNREEERRVVADNLIVTKTFELEKNKLDLEKSVKELEDTKTAILNILEDLQEERDFASKERDKIDAILQSIGDAVFVVDSDLKITVFNKVAEELSGYSTEQVIGKKYNKVLKFIFEDTKKENDKFIKDSIEKGIITSMSNHTMLINKDKKEIPVSDSAAPLKDSNGKVIGCVVVFRDVTKEREVDKAKTEFVSLASHQLRTPLSAINWYSEMLTAGDAGKVNKQQKEFLDEIHNGSKRMVDLVNSLLNVSRIDVGTFAIDPKPTDIVEIAKSLVKEMQVTIEKKNLILVEKYDKIPITPLDPNLTRIVIQNILSNAIKYTDPKKTINISITVDKENINIEIADEGFGIPKAQQGKVFEKLFRADNVRQKDVEGTGLGLYIVKSIVETSGGTIKFSSEENKGTTFFITIPLSGMKKKEGSKDLSA